MAPVRFLAKRVILRLLYGMMVMLLVACSAVSSDPKPVTSKSAQQATRPASSFRTQLKSADDKFLIQLSITPNRLGINKFVVSVKDAHSGKAETQEQAQLFTTMLDMDMGTGVILLQSTGDGSYSASSELPMDGNWDIHVQLLDEGIHIAKVKVYTPA